jgi:aryl-alcohol dehydrogenase-like predicted oxidoreductase
MIRRASNGQGIHTVGLGCMPLSCAYVMPPPEADAMRLLYRTQDNGCHFLDAADIYGFSHNETLTSEASKGRWTEYFLASKTGMVVAPRRGIYCSPAATAAYVHQSSADLFGKVVITNKT